jgi:hypothetical protein
MYGILMGYGILTEYLVEFNGMCFLILTYFHVTLMHKNATIIGMQWDYTWDIVGSNQQNQQ